MNERISPLLHLLERIGIRGQGKCRREIVDAVPRVTNGLGQLRNTALFERREGLGARDLGLFGKRAIAVAEYGEPSLPTYLRHAG